MEKEKIKNKEYYIDKILLKRFYKAKERATKLNKDFDITFDYIKQINTEQKGKCNITGIELTYLIGEGRTPTNVSLDRIDSSKGYIKGNIQLICSAINMMKSDLTMEEFKYYCKKVLGHE